MLQAATAHANSNQGRVLFKGKIHSRKYGMYTHNCMYARNHMLVFTNYITCTPSVIIIYLPKSYETKYGGQ